MAKRTEGLTPFYVMEILELAKELEKRGEEIIHMEVGEPDFQTSPIIKEAVKKAIDRGETFYTNSMGIPELRESVAEHYKNQYGIDVDPENVLITSGTSPAMLIAFLTLVGKGDEVLVTEPAYPCYKNFIKIVEAKPVGVPLIIENGFVPEVQRVKKLISPKSRLLIVNSPNNPTGSLYPEKVLSELSSFGVTILSDEIYHGLTYGRKAHSILEFTDNAFVINGFSKAYAMTGFRLGYMIFPEKYRRVIQNIHQNFFISANSFVQWGGITALKSAQKEREELRKKFESRRKVLLDVLGKYGLAPPVEPEGAFYVMVDLRKWMNNSLEFAKELLLKKKVGVTPGIDFGEAAEGMIRLAYTVDENSLVEGVEKLVEFLRERFGFNG